MGLFDLFSGDSEEKQEAGGLSETFQEESPQLQAQEQAEPAVTNDWHLPKNPFSKGGDTDEKKPSASQQAYKEHDEYEHSERRMRDREIEEAQSTKPMRHAAFRARMHQEDTTHPKFHEPDEREMTKTQVYQSISQQRPGLSQPLKRMMTGHSFGEQPGKGIVGWNYFGQELGSRFGRPADNVNWTRAYRSATISRAEYEAEPDMFVDWPGHPSIEQQLADGKKELYVWAWAPRPFFLSLDSATNAFVYGIIDWRLKALQSSKHPEHQALASRVEAGDVDAYIQMVEMNDPELRMRPYNGLPEYPGIVKPHLLRAIGDDKLTD